MPNVQLWPVLEALPRTSDPVPCLVGGDWRPAQTGSSFSLETLQQTLTHNITGMTSFNVLIC